jgi:hypothetical protein
VSVTVPSSKISAGAIFEAKFLQGNTSLRSRQMTLPWSEIDDVHGARMIVQPSGAGAKFVVPFTDWPSGARVPK